MTRYILARVTPDLMMVRKGACDGQTDNPNSDFNVTVQNLSRNTPDPSKVASSISVSSAMSFNGRFSVSCEPASGPALCRASTEFAKCSMRKTSLGRYPPSRSNILASRARQRARA
jgi:hypothetical protein